MPMIVSDSSTLIHLARIGRLALLKDMVGTVAIPTAVWREIVLEGKDRPGAKDVQVANADGWIQVSEPSNHHLLRILKNELDEGEAEAIALAIEQQAELLLIDESEGRRIAGLYDLPKTGVIGILIRAKLDGRIASLRQELDALREDGRFWIAKPLYRRALQEVDENEGGKDG